MSFIVSDRRGWKADINADGAGRVDAAFVVGVDGASSALDAMETASSNESIPQPGEVIDDTAYRAGDHTVTILNKTNSGSYICSVTVPIYAEMAHPDQPRLTIRSGMQTQETFRDVFGQLLTVEYEDPNENVSTSLSSVEKYVPTADVQIEGVYTLPEGTTPVTVLDDWLGKINSDVFIWFSIGSLLCSGVSMEPAGNNAGRWKIRFDFMLRGENGYDELIYYKDSNGDTPPDITIDNGERVVQIYQAAYYNTIWPYDSGLAPVEES